MDPSEVEVDNEPSPLDPVVQRLKEDVEEDIRQRGKRNDQRRDSISARRIRSKVEVGLTKRLDDYVEPPNVAFAITLRKPGSLLELLSNRRAHIFAGVALCVLAGHLVQVGYQRWLNNYKWTAFMYTAVGPLLSMVSLVMMAFFEALREQYDVAEDKTIRPLNADELFSLQQRLPWSWTEPGVESAQWVNDLLTRLWPIFNRHIYNTLNTLCGGEEWYLNNVIGPVNYVANFRVKSASLGKQVPQLTGIRVLSRGVRREDLIIEAEVTYDGDVDFSVGGRFAVNLGLDMVYFRGRVRLILSPLMSQWPGVGGMTISFMSTPQIDWHFVGLLRLLNIYPLKRLLNKVVAHFLLNPQRVAVNFADITTSDRLGLRAPISLLKVKVLGAKGLPGAEVPPEATANTYCLVVVDGEGEEEGQEKTSKWFDDTFFLVKNRFSFVQMFIYKPIDENQDRLIGYFGMSTTEISDSSHLNGRPLTASLIDPDTRQVLNDGKATISFRISWLQLNTDTRALSQHHNNGEVPLAVLSLRVDSVSGLDMITSKRIETFELRPLVRMTVGNVVKVSTIKDRTGNPVFEETFDFFLFNPRLDSIRLEVVDMVHVMRERHPQGFLSFGSESDRLADWAALSVKGNVLGSVELQVADILRSDNMILEAKYQLQSIHIENGYVRLQAAVRVIKFSTTVTENEDKTIIDLPVTDLS